VKSMMVAIRPSHTGALGFVGAVFISISHSSNGRQSSCPR
jgi:hypothetical protein